MYMHRLSVRNRAIVKEACGWVGILSNEWVLLHGLWRFNGTHYTSAFARLE